MHPTARTNRHSYSQCGSCCWPLLPAVSSRTSQGPCPCPYPCPRPSGQTLAAYTQKGVRSMLALFGKLSPPRETGPLSSLSLLSRSVYGVLLCCTRSTLDSPLFTSHASTQSLVVAMGGPNFLPCRSPSLSWSSNGGWHGAVWTDRGRMLRGQTAARKTQDVGPDSHDVPLARMHSLLRPWCHPCTPCKCVRSAGRTIPASLPTYVPVCSSVPSQETSSKRKGGQVRPITTLLDM